MMERTLSYENLNELVESIRAVDFGKLSEVTAAIKNMKSEIDPEVIKNMADIMRLNDPNLTRLNDTLNSDAADEAVEKH